MNRIAVSLMSTLARRLCLSEEQFAAARRQLIKLDLIACRAPLYQVLALPGTVAPARRVLRAPALTDAAHSAGGAEAGQPVSPATLWQQAQAQAARVMASWKCAGSSAREPVGVLPSVGPWAQPCPDLAGRLSRLRAL